MEETRSGIIRPFNLSDSPHDETCDDGDPGDAAGLGPFAVFIHVLAAAAQADQVHGQNQQAQTQTHGSDARQKYQRLRAAEGKEAKVRKAFYFEEQVHLNQRCSTSRPQISVKKRLLLCGLKLSGWLTPPPESSTALSENNPPASNHTRV